MLKKMFPQWSTIIGCFMTASIIPLQLILVSQLWIFPPSQLMIKPPCIKEPHISHICYQLSSLLPLKILLVFWPPIIIRHISFLLMVIILSMLWRKICLWKVGFTEDTVVGNMVEKYATKRQGSITPYALMKTRNFIIFMWFPG